MLNFVTDGAGKDVIFLHPVGLDLHCWHEVATRLRERCRLIRVDLRGHGRSPRADDGLQLADFAADLHEVVESLDQGPPAMVGLSFGGMVAQQYALDHPGKLTHLVVAGCPCTLPDSVREVLRARGSNGLTRGMASQVEETLQRWFTPQFIAAGGAEGTRTRLLATDPAAWNSAWHAISNIRTATRLHEIEVPTLCIAGALDSAAPPAALLEITKRIKGARQLVLPATPHMMQIEQPEQFASALSSFLFDHTSAKAPLAN